MKGLLLKDFYIAKSLLKPLLIRFFIIGAIFLFFIDEWVLPVLATTTIAMNIIATTIIIDRNAGWCKSFPIFPLSPNSMVISKFILHILLSIVVLTFGSILSLALNFIFNTWNYEMFAHLLSMAISISLFGGSILIPLSFLSDEKRYTMRSIIIDVTIILIIIIYLCAVFLFTELRYMIYIGMILLSIVCFLLSMTLSSKFIKYQKIK